MAQTRRGRMQLLFIFGALLPALAAAQQYPVKTVRMLTEFAAGSAGDVLARVVVTSLTPLLGQPVVLDYRPGAGGALSAELTARASADGYTLLMATSNPFVVRPFLAKSTPYDPVKDFTPVTTLTEPVVLIVSHPSTGIANVRALLDFAKRNPGRLTYATSGIGSTHHLTGEQIHMLGGVDLVHVPYKSLTQALTAVASGEVTVALSLSGFALPLIKAGKVSSVAVVNDTRLAALPDVSTVAEALPGFRMPPTWAGIFGPAGLPAPVLQRFHGETMRVLAQPEVRGKLQEVGYAVLGETPQEFSTRLNRDRELIGRIVRAANIEPIE